MTVEETGTYVVVRGGMVVDRSGIVTVLDADVLDATDFYMMGTDYRRAVLAEVLDLKNAAYEVGLGDLAVECDAFIREHPVARP